MVDGAAQTSGERGLPFLLAPEQSRAKKREKREKREEREVHGSNSNAHSPSTGFCLIPKTLLLLLQLQIRIFICINSVVYVF